MSIFMRFLIQKLEDNVKSHNIPHIKTKMHEFLGFNAKGVALFIRRVISAQKYVSVIAW